MMVRHCASKPPLVVRFAECHLVLQNHCSSLHPCFLFSPCVPGSWPSPQCLHLPVVFTCCPSHVTQRRQPHAHSTSHCGRGAHAGSERRRLCVRVGLWSTWAGPILISRSIPAHSTPALWQRTSTLRHSSCMSPLRCRLADLAVQLGLGDKEPRATPTVIESLSRKVAMAAAGAFHSVFLLTTGLYVTSLQFAASTLRHITPSPLLCPHSATPVA